MTDERNIGDEVAEPPIEPTKAVPADIPNADPVLMTRDSAQIVEGTSIRMEQSAAFSVLADDVDMRDSAGFIVRAEEVRIVDSVTFVLAAGEVKGNVTTIFTPATAAILAGAIIIGMWLIRPRR
jgi:hypothetical protein